MASTYKSYKYQNPFPNNTPGATAKKMAAASSGKPAPKPQPKKNPFSGMSDAQIKAKYKGMSQADKKKFGMQMHAAAMANRKKGGAKAVSTTSQPSAKPKAAGTKPVQKQSKPKQQNTGSGRDGTFGKGTYGKGRPSDGNKGTGRDGKLGDGTHGKLRPSDSKKSKLNPQQRRKAAQIKRRRGMSLSDVASKISDKLRLTYKKGELVRRGDKVYRSDGKGKLTLVHRKQF